MMVDGSNRAESGIPNALADIARQFADASCPARSQARVHDLVLTYKKREGSLSRVIVTTPRGSPSLARQAFGCKQGNRGVPSASSSRYPLIDA
jgi:hypothetical protein